MQLNIDAFFKTCQPKKEKKPLTEPKKADKSSEDESKKNTQIPKPTAPITSKRTYAPKEDPFIEELSDSDDEAPRSERISASPTTKRPLSKPKHSSDDDDFKPDAKEEPDEEFEFSLSDESSDDEIEEKPITEKKAIKVQSKSALKSTPKKKTPKLTIPHTSSSCSSADESSDPDRIVCNELDENGLDDWLTPAGRRDKEGHYMDEDDYDPSTILIPPGVQEKFTDFQKKYWDIKKDHFDEILMVRKGKFYEMFYTDAIFARDVLKLKLTMRGNEPMCGVPEKSLEEWIPKINKAGKHICRVEQTETVIDKKNRKNGSKEGLKRELVQIYTPGTIDNYELLETSRPCYLMTVKGTDLKHLGVTLVDCSVGSFYIGEVDQDQFSDYLIKFAPSEIVYKSSQVSKEVVSIINQTKTAKTQAKDSNDEWEPKNVIARARALGGWDVTPEFLLELPEEALGSFGGCVSYLNRSKIADSVLKLKRFFPITEISSTYMELDSSALRNLFVIGDGKTLLSVLDHCYTPFGKRKFYHLLLHPLTSPTAINQRLDAVEELANMPDIESGLEGLPDLERIITRIYSNRCTPKLFLSTITNLKKCCRIISKLSSVESSVLKALIKEANPEEALKELKVFEDSIDENESIKTGQFVVKSGTYEDVDKVDREIKQIDGELQDVLQKIQKQFKSRDITYTHMLGVKYQVTIPIVLCKNLGVEYELKSKTKTVQRYHTPQIKKLLAKMEEKENERLHLRDSMQLRITQDFQSKESLWNELIEVIGTLDSLLSLNAAGSSWNGPSCRPVFDTTSEKSFLSVTEALNPLVSDCIPNDIRVEDVILLTGPNASGKSTFARMCCLIIILAQIGCRVPASSCEMTVFDGIYTRIGAGDRMFKGQSTFNVELMETAKIMKRATKRSFVVLDELGRGTSTVDGIAIATSVLEYFIREIQCPMVFCTHYHVLTEKFHDFKEVKNCSMKFTKDFVLLYQIVDGPCTSSFGCEVAKKCGIPNEIADEAQRIANEYEESHQGEHIKGRLKK